MMLLNKKGKVFETMSKNIREFTPNAPIRNVAAKVALPDYENEEALFVGGDARPTEPVILSPNDSQRLWETVHSKEPIVLTERMQEAVANYKRIMSKGLN